VDDQPGGIIRLGQRAAGHVADEVGVEIITLAIKDRVQDYEVLYGDGPRFLRDSARFARRWPPPAFCPRAAPAAE